MLEASHSRILRTIPVLIAASLFALPAQAQYSGGTGEPNNPYQIATAADLIALGETPDDYDKHFILSADIDLDPNLPGRCVFDDAVIAGDFAGSLDGEGHTIRNLCISAPEESGLGLFHFIAWSGRVRNLSLEGVVITGASVIGAVAGGCDGTIENCCASINITGISTVGGLVGDNWQGTITRCRARGIISGRSHAAALGGLVGYNTGTISGCRAAVDVVAVSSASGLGGLVGEMGYFGCIVGNEKGAILNCCATGNLWAGDKSYDLGGLVGAHMEGTIVNCYATGTVTAGDDSAYLGGLVGENGAPGGYAAMPGIHMGTIINCYASGHIEGGQNRHALGGLVGRNVDGSIIHCFWDTETTGLNTSDGGRGAPTLDMGSAQMFRAVGWDLIGESENGTAELWQVPEHGGYPVLTMFAEDHERRQLVGTGTLEDPFQIATPEDIGTIHHYAPSASYRLTADIDLADVTWSAAPIPDLDGTFDGAGFSIRNLNVRGGGHLGLFGTLGAHASVLDLRLQDARILAAEHAWCVGVFAAQNHGDISRCGVTGAIDVGDYARATGGLVGDQSVGEISECYAEVQVSGGENVTAIGGLIGSEQLGTVTNCYTCASVSSGQSSEALGGLIGEDYSGAITYCYTSGAVVVEDSDNKTVGPVLGYSYRSTGANCYYLTSDILTGPKGDWSLPLTNEQMRRQATFAGWDFVDETENGMNDIWWIDEGQDYPHLWWELLADDAVVFVVDDFEDYNDVEGHEIFMTWLTPFNLPVNGGILGHFDPPYAEQTIVHSGLQSMPFYYANTKGIVNSRAYRAFYPAQDWTTNDAVALVLWFRGVPDNDVDALYIAVNGKTIFHPDPNAVLVDTWTPWIIPLSSLAGAGVNTGHVTSMEIGIGDNTQPSQNASGLLYIDDVRVVKDAVDVQSILEDQDYLWPWWEPQN